MCHALKRTGSVYCVVLGVFDKWDPLDSEREKEQREKGEYRGTSVATLDRGDGDGFDSGKWL